MLCGLGVYQGLSSNSFNAEIAEIAETIQLIHHRGPKSKVRSLGPDIAVQLYYITDRSAFAGDEASRWRGLLAKIGEAARAHVDYIQLRERDLPAGELEVLARQAVGVIAEAYLAEGSRQPATSLLINSRTDVVLAAGAQGVHLRGDDVSPRDVKAIWDKREAGADSARPIISVSCHINDEVQKASADGADVAMFAPVFGKKDAPATRAGGIARLREACRNDIPVMALGGVTLENAGECIDAGAAGIAAIRLFQENDIATVVRELRRQRVGAAASVRCPAERQSL